MAPFGSLTKWPPHGPISQKQSYVDRTSQGKNYVPTCGHHNSVYMGVKDHKQDNKKKEKRNYLEDPNKLDTGNPPLLNGSLGHTPGEEKSIAVVISSIKSNILYDYRI